MFGDLKSSRYRMAMLLALLAAVLLVPFAGNLYHVHLVTLMAIYWILISTLTMLVGYTGQLSIGHAGILAIGAYTYSILTGKLDCNAFLAIAAAGGMCGLCGLLLGLPSLRLPGFYFALATIAFAVIVGENIISWSSLTGGGTGLLVTELPEPLNTPESLYWLSIVIALGVTLLCCNLARSMWGRNMIAVRDSEVAALSVGIAPFRTKLTVFVFAGAFAGVSGAFFALAQNYILPESFHFDLSLFFFVSIIIGGRGELLGPFLGSVILFLLPEMMGALAQYASLFYGFALILVVLVVPRGLGQTIAAFFEKKTESPSAVEPDIPALTNLLTSGGRT